MNVREVVVLCWWNLLEIYPLVNQGMLFTGRYIPGGGYRWMLLATGCFWPPGTAGEAAGTESWRSCLGHRAGCQGSSALQQPGTGEATCSTKACQLSTMDPGNKIPFSCSISPVSPAPFTDKAYRQLAKQLKRPRSTFVEQAITYEFGVERQYTENKLFLLFILTV